MNWAQQLVNTIRQGGVWGWPEMGLVYRFDHENRTVTLTSGENPEAHEWVRKQFAEILWIVKP